MNKKYPLTLILILLLFVVCTPLFSLELGVVFSLENLYFAKNRAETDTSFAGPVSLDGWGGELSVTHQLADNVGLQAGFFNDTILRYISYTLFTYNIQIIELGVGPFFGLFNSRSTLLKSGISTSVKLEIPGIIFAQFRADNSIGGRLIETGDYIQERNDIALGFYVYNAICTLALNTRKFTQKTSKNEVVDGLVEYSFSTDIFQKNLPYRLIFGFAYQSMSKKYFDLADLSAKPTNHTLNSIILSTEADIALTDYMRLLLGLESSIYTFGQKELLGLSNPGPGGFLFRAYTGIRFDFDRLSARRRATKINQ